MKINGLNFNPAATDASLVAERTGSTRQGGDAFAQLFAAADRGNVTKAQRAASSSPVDRKPARETIEGVEHDADDDTETIEGRDATDEAERRPRPSRPDGESDAPDVPEAPTDESEASAEYAEIGAGQATNATREAAVRPQSEAPAEDPVQESAARLAALREAVLAAEGEAEVDIEAAEPQPAQTAEGEAAQDVFDPDVDNPAAALATPLQTTEAADIAQAPATPAAKAEPEAKLDNAGRPLFTTLSDVAESAKPVDTQAGGDAEGDAKSRDDAPRPQQSTPQPSSAAPAPDIDIDVPESAPPTPAPGTPASSGVRLMDESVMVTSVPTDVAATATSPAIADPAPAATPTAPTATVEVNPIAPAPPSAAGVNAAGAAQPTAGLADVDGERVAEQAMRGLRGAIAQKGGGVTLRLNPGELGQIKIQVDMQGGMVKAQIHTVTETARTLLQQQIHSLKASLEGHGLTVESLNVTQTSSSNGASFQQADDQSPNDGRSRGFNASQQQSGDDADGNDTDTNEQQAQTFDQQLLDLVA